MKHTIQFQPCLLLGAALILGSEPPLLALTVDRAAPFPHSILSAQAKSQRYTPPKPPSRGAPGKRGSGGSRSSGTACLPVPSRTVSRADDAPTADMLVAIAPEFLAPSTKAPHARSVTQVWSLTAAERPTLWFNVPYSREFARAQFVLQDENETKLYETPVTLPEKPGIIAVRVPEQVAALEPGKLYHWYFKVRIACNPQEKGTLEYVDGWVERTTLAPAIAQRLQTASPIEQAELYADAGIWYDAVTVLAELQRANAPTPANAAAWSSLIETVQLERLQSVPLVQP
jgi:hypothetical protein